MAKLANRDSLYGRRWRKTRADHLACNPLCEYCKRHGRVTLATVVDHKKPHRGDPLLFWDEENWQSLCQPCHDSLKQAEEKSGFVKGCGLDGLPIDPNHHWAGDRNPRGGGEIPTGLASGHRAPKFACTTADESSKEV